MNRKDSVKILDNITKSIPSNGEYNISPPEGYDAVENVSLNVNVPQPSLQNTLTRNITENGSITILPSSGYDALRQVEINTSVPNQTTHLDVTSNGNYSPVSPYIGYNSVSVTVPQLQNEYLQNKRITNIGNYSVQDLMNNPSNYEGITKNSNIIVDVPQLDVTQISNYSITSNGNQNIPIPSGYDAVDSINVNVNVPNSTTTKSITSNGTYTPESPYIGFSSVNVNVTQEKIKINRYSVIVNGALNYIRYSDFSRNNSSSSVNVNVPYGRSVIVFYNGTSYFAFGMFYNNRESGVPYSCIIPSNYYYKVLTSGGSARVYLWDVNANWNNYIYDYNNTLGYHAPSIAYFNKTSFDLIITE